MISITAMALIMWLIHSKAVLALGAVSHYKDYTEEEGEHGDSTESVGCIGILPSFLKAVTK